MQDSYEDSHADFPTKPSPLRPRGAQSVVMAFCNLCTKRAALHALFAALCKLPWELLIEEAELCEKQSPRLTAHYAHKEVP